MTVTDHDSIDAVEALRSRRDFFGEEVTCKLPRGPKLHVGVYDITELFFSANHVFSSLTGRRDAADFAVFGRCVSRAESKNAADCASPRNGPRARQERWRYRLTRDVFAIGREMVRENANTMAETVFVHYGQAPYLCAVDRRDAVARIVEAPAWRGP